MDFLHFLIKNTNKLLKKQALRRQYGENEKGMCLKALADICVRLRVRSAFDRIASWRQFRNIFTIIHQRSQRRSDRAVEALLANLSSRTLSDRRIQFQSTRLVSARQTPPSFERK